jgi:acetyl esterase/lipase
MIFTRRRCVSLVCAAAILSFTPQAQPQKITKDLTYTVAAGDPQLGDLYEPSGAGPFPAIVYIHGGSWRSGNKKVYRRLATDLASNGYAGFAINYDLHPHSFPTSLDEAKDAVRFLRSHAVEYRIDPNRIVIAGDSAGGEIAALVALANGDASAAVSAAVIFNGVYRLSSSEFLYVYVITRYLGVRCLAQPDICKQASPLQQVHPGAPPFFIGHGTADHTVPFGESELFVHALQDQHVPVSTYIAAGGPHSYWKKKAYYGANLTAVESFLSGALQPATKP